ncbi:MAG TPA: chemotaxis response regulator protein-glutamate methylesterase [Elusimicrobiota bacterium]|nr:chemotaxis response regulator protein-glutamate methylesterase [Elusimicrobiota bacterium]
MTAAAPLHVLVVDDSAVVREVLTDLLSQDPGLTVATAGDPMIAMTKMRIQRPQVIVLDLELPRMDGLTFLRKIMTEDPIPVVVCSSQTPAGSDEALRALEEGAVDVIAKARLGVREFLRESSDRLLDAVRSAATARVAAARRPPAVPFLGSKPLLTVTTDKVMALGASTGGTEALREILQALPPSAPGVVIVQHMPEGFTNAFARRLDSICRVEVKEAADGDRVLAGRALIGPGNRHTTLRRSGGHYIVEVKDGPLVSRHRPSVDVLFESVAAEAGRNAVGAILTGMGSDGARGLLAMRNNGARTLAQDEASCVVFGMPAVAIAQGAVDRVVPLERMAEVLLAEANALSGKA